MNNFLLSEEITSAFPNLLGNCLWVLGQCVYMQMQPLYGLYLSVSGDYISFYLKTVRNIECGVHPTVYLSTLLEIESEIPIYRTRRRCFIRPYEFAFSFVYGNFPYRISVCKWKFSTQICKRILQDLNS
jgi:hypothetical protein